MEFESMQLLIGTLGFPIVAFLLLFFYQLKAMDLLKTTIDNNTKAIIKIGARLGIEEDEK